MYGWLRRGLFALPPETAHEVALCSLRLAAPLGLGRLLGPPPPSLPVHCLGLDFPNPVGLAAGLDKNGDYIDAMGRLGFGFIEVGTVTPAPQPGNPKPRMFRISEHEALINRLGFNNKGVDHLVERLRARRFKGPVGANIGKQKETPVSEAPGDYRHCLERVHAHCDYVTVNISSPNTANLRELQDTGPLSELLTEIRHCRARLEREQGQRRPLLVKIAPDWDDEALDRSLAVIADSGVDGLIATNTSIDHEPVAGTPYADEAGGLSGAPIRPRADHVLERARQALGPDFPIIGLGGITRGADAAEKRRLGADLVQLYTGFIYHGPALVSDCVRAMAAMARSRKQ